MVHVFIRHKVKDYGTSAEPVNKNETVGSQV